MTADLTASVAPTVHPSLDRPVPGARPSGSPLPARRRRRLGPPRPGARWALGAAVAVATFGVLVAVLGLHTSAPVGVADNADGTRLSCAAGLTPDTPEGTAAWRGVVVTAFRVDGATCAGVPMPLSSGEVLLRGAVALAGPADVWSLRWLGVLSVGLVALGAGLAAVAASATSRRRAAVVALPLLPLVAVPWWSRFFVSTYSEPAGLLGTTWLLLGAAALAVTLPEQRRSRLLALGLVVAGGVTAGTAKPAFAPVALAAALLAAVVVLRAPGAGHPGRGTGRTVRRVGWRTSGPAAAVVVLALVTGPVAAAIAWQDEAYATINTHNLVFTGVLPVVGPEATGPLGLPPAAADRAGEGFYLRRGEGIAGWTPTLGERPAQTRAAALDLLAQRPDAAVAMVGRGLEATLRPQLPYLTSAARGTVPDFTEPKVLHRDSPLDSRILLDHLDGMALRWLPAAVVALALLAASGTLVPRVRRRIGPAATGLVRVAALTAGTAVALVAVAVAGDGFYELTKHVWLASSTLLVAGLFLLAGLGAGVVTGLRRPPPP